MLLEKLASELHGLTGPERAYAAAEFARRQGIAVDPEALTNASFETSVPERRSRSPKGRRSKAALGKAAVVGTIIGRQLFGQEPAEGLLAKILRSHPELTAPGVDPLTAHAEVVRLATQAIKEDLRTFVGSAAQNLPAAMRAYRQAMKDRLHRQCLPFYQEIRSRFPTLASLVDRPPWKRPTIAQPITTAGAVPQGVTGQVAVALAARLPLALADLAFEIGVGFDAWPDLPPERGRGAGQSRQRTLPTELHVAGALVRKWTGTAPVPVRVVDLLDDHILRVLYDRRRGGPAHATDAAVRLLISPSR